MTRAALKKRPTKGRSFAEIAVDARSFFAGRGLALTHGQKRTAFELYLREFNDRRRSLTSIVYEDWPSFDYDSFRKTWASFDRNGLDAFNDRRNGHQNQERGHFHRHPDQARIAETIIVSNRRLQSSDRWLHKLLVEALLQANLKPLPTLKQTRSFRTAYLAQHENDLFVLRSPDRAKGSLRPSVGRRVDRATRPNEIVEIDFTPANVVTDDGKRPVIGTAIDVFTRRRVDIVLESESSQAVAEIIMRYLVEHGGPIGRLRMDNGRGFVSGHILSSCRAFEIEVEIVPPFSGDAKGVVERAHRTLADQLFPLLNAYIGRNVAERQAIREETTFDKRGREKERLVSVALDRGRLQKVIDDWTAGYHNTAHSDLGCSPNEMAARHRGRWSRLDEAQLPLLALCFAKPAGRGVATVGKEGLRIDGRDYACPELFAPRMSGARVLVKEHPTDAGQVMVFEDHDKFIGIAVNPELAGIDRAEWAARCRAAYEAARKKIVGRARELKRTGPDIQRLAIDHFERSAKQYRAITVLATVTAHDAPGITGAQQAHNAMQSTAGESQPLASPRTPPVIDFDSGTRRTFRDDNDRLHFWSALHERIASGASLHPRYRQWYDDNADLFAGGHEQLRAFEQRGATSADGPKSSFG